MKPSARVLFAAAGALMAFALAFVVVALLAIRGLA
jgi:hypothetical protein